MFLSQLILNPRSREVQRDVADCHQLHRTIMAAFPNVAGSSARQQLSVLYRIEPTGPGSALIVLVQSRVQPDWSHLNASYFSRRPAVKDISQALHSVTPGARLRFRLRANPTRLIRPDTRKNGQRVELRSEKDKLQWLSRTGSAAGFHIAGTTDVIVFPTEKLVGRRNGGAPITVSSSLFEGILQVTDDGAFTRVLEIGLGRAKAYGCGLLSVAPSRQR